MFKALRSFHFVNALTQLYPFVDTSTADTMLFVNLAVTISLLEVVLINLSF